MAIWGDEGRFSSRKIENKSTILKLEVVLTSIRQLYYILNFFDAVKLVSRSLLCVSTFYLFFGILESLYRTSMRQFLA